MRQFFTWRIWAAFALLIGLALLVTTLMSSSATPGPTEASASARSIDFVSVLYSVAPSPDFSIVNGVTVGSADAIIDGHRTMHIVPGTLGSNTCPGFSTEIGKCAVLANLLGDAVVWFAMVPVETGPTVTAPPIVALLKNGFVELQNGWVLKAASTVDRVCPQETTSLTDFIARFGPASTTVIDVSKQRVMSVQCAASVTAST